MDDNILLCPICSEKLKNKHWYNIQIIKDSFDYIERSCTNGLNHFFKFFYNTKSNKIDYMKFSISPDYSKIVEIDFIKNETLISCYSNNSSSKDKLTLYPIKKILVPDFPDLKELINKVNYIILLS